MFSFSDHVLCPGSQGTLIEEQPHPCDRIGELAGALRQSSRLVRLRLPVVNITPPSRVRPPRRQSRYEFGRTDLDAMVVVSVGSDSHGHRLLQVPQATMACLGKISRHANCTSTWPSPSLVHDLSITTSRQGHSCCQLSLQPLDLSLSVQHMPLHCLQDLPNAQGSWPLQKFCCSFFGLNKN
jgi:hypothetical protein